MAKARRAQKWMAAFGGATVAVVAGLAAATTPGDRGLTPGSRVVVDAHNCYPYKGRWADRIERALGTGVPVAIEQDLLWFTDRQTGRSWSLLSHDEHADGSEPVMEKYFFERIRPLMERALADPDHSRWPLVTLNLDFKSDEAAHHRAVLELLGRYKRWLCTARKSADRGEVTVLRPGPLLVLTGEDDSQERDFYDALPDGEDLLLFGAVHGNGNDPTASPEQLVPEGATSYRRWWNNSWYVVEPEGQPRARRWTEAKRARLRSLVEYAHHKGLWIRFYTLNGHPPELLTANGWDAGYNFGSLTRVEARWQSEVRAGVDYIATDQYEDLAAMVRKLQ